MTQQGIQLDKVRPRAPSARSGRRSATTIPASRRVSTSRASAGSSATRPTPTVSQEVLADYLGAAYATYQYSQTGPIANFATTTHSPPYTGNLELRNWVGGWAFNRDRDFLDYVHGIAVTYHFQNCDENGQNCSPCTRSTAAPGFRAPPGDDGLHHPVESLQPVPGARRSHLHLLFDRAGVYGERGEDFIRTTRFASRCFRARRRQSSRSAAGREQEDK